jgi:hypothetical protein
VHPGLLIGLQKLSKEAVLETFMAIEHPNWEPLALLAGEVFATIGALYEAIQAAFDALPDAAITGANQVTRSPGLFAIKTKADTTRAIARIRMQGEGTQEVPNPGGVLAHYYRFAEIWHERELVQVDAHRWTYTGAAVPFPGNILPMPPVPSGGFPQSHDFNVIYSDLLRLLQAAWQSGGPLSAAVGKMGDLAEPARQLIRQSVGPSFLFLP